MNFTTIEQSERLIKLGLSLSTSDMYYDGYAFDNNGNHTINLGKFDGEYDIPAWSLASLIEVLPSEIKKGTFTYKIDIRKYKLTDKIDLYQIAYGNYGESGSWHDMINTAERESMLEAVYDMLCWILEERNRI